jgi:ATP-dependent Clp protease ATP-binding subunit ClpC
MFERFTDQARRAVVLAQEEARIFNHNYIGTEHLLLGLLQEGEGTAARALESMGITAEAARSVVEARVRRGRAQPTGRIPFTPAAKKSLEGSLTEAVGLGQDYIGTGHVLLALIRTGEGVAVEALVSLGADLDQVRERVSQRLPDDTERRPAAGLRRATLREEPRQAGIGALFDVIDDRLGAIEQHLGITRAEAEPGRGAGPGSAPGEGSGRADDAARLRTEVDRLRTLLREHGIDPGDAEDPPAAAG